jgi:nitrobindin-like protein
MNEVRETSASRLADEVAPLAFLLGTWRGQGAGEFPTVSSFLYGEEMVFEHVGDAFLLYSQRSWLLEDGAPLHFERGFLRPGKRPGRVELTLAHPLGLVEVSEGTVEGTTLDLATTLVGATTTGEGVTSLERHVVVDADAMRYELRMATREVPLVRHLVAELRRT